MRIPGAVLLCAMLTTSVARGEEPNIRPSIPPMVHLTWKAPYGDPRSATNIVASCADTSEADTLYITLVSPRNVLPMLGMSATLLFESQAGDTLGAFWEFERGAQNGGNLLVDFDLLASEYCTSPWQAFVGGRVGYTRAGRRGRLDLTAEVPLAKAFNLNPGACYFFSRVAIRRKRPNLAGCGQPIRITLAGGKFYSSRLGSERLSFVKGPDRSVTWNAPARGIRCRHTGLAIETWIPRHAPPSWSAMPKFPADRKPAEAESE